MPAGGVCDIDEKLSGLQHPGKAPGTGEKPSIAGNVVLPHVVIFREGHQSTKGSGPQWFQRPL